MGTIVKQNKQLYKAISENKRFSLAIFICFMAILKIQYSNVESTEYLGIADTKEININSSHSVKIRNIHVIPGQTVEEDELLMELERPDLDLRIYELESQLNELKAENSFNSEMNKELKSVKVSNNENMDSPLQIKINSMTKQLIILKRKKADLFVFSKRAGVIGSINVKVGEDASPFTPLITMHDSAPSMIKGFIHESIYNKTYKGQKVVVTSISDPNKIMDAVVASVGNRIVEYPVRLRKSEASVTYGREVVIFVSKDNPFLIGEKVQIKSFEKPNEIMTAHAQAVPVRKIEDVIDLEIGVDIENTKVEPSGLVYIKDLNQTVMISDDTGRKDRPYIYTVNNSGLIDKEIEIEGVKAISDMEAISMDENGIIYIASSMSEKKNGKVSDKRKKLLMIERNDFNFKAIGEVNFYDALNKVAKSNKSEEWAQVLLAKGNKKIRINIEGILVKENTMYFGLRSGSKLTKDQFVLLKINDIKSVFAKNAIDADQISIQANVAFPIDSDFKNEGVSDIALINGELYVLTVNNTGKEGGRVLKTVLADPSNHMTELKRFKGLKPEGITYDTSASKFLISFDQGDKKSKLLLVDKF
ncbi:MAG: hypothetical protein CME70_23660 [Halobacteriovorax sp.]|nr:hypothetical protein [Halobacteriovorax sp.]|tara:strand:+ start:181032 stop:182801 length:1770 start_codon:yes stop_codon:yes gene_type:complete